MLVDFPRNEYSTRVKRLLSESREKLARHELEVAKFYAKQGLYKASAYRLASLDKNFGDTKYARSAIEQLKKERPEDAPKVLSLLDQQLEKQANIKSEKLIPEIPKLVVAENETIPLLKRFRLEEAKKQIRKAKADTNSAERIALNNTPTIETDQKDEFSTTARLACEDVDGIAVYTTYFDKRSSVVANSRQKSEQIKIAISTPFAAKKALQNKSPSCALANSRVTLTANKKTTSQFDLRVDLPKNAQYELLELDRPNRVVVLVLEKS
jgi:hypothetical protein